MCPSRSSICTLLPLRTRRLLDRRVGCRGAGSLQRTTESKLLRDRRDRTRAEAPRKPRRDRRKRGTEPERERAAVGPSLGSSRAEHTSPGHSGKATFFTPSAAGSARAAIRGPNATGGDLVCGQASRGSTARVAAHRRRSASDERSRDPPSGFQNEAKRWWPALRGTFRTEERSPTAGPPPRKLRLRVERIACPIRGGAQSTVR